MSCNVVVSCFRTRSRETNCIALTDIPMSDILIGANEARCEVGYCEGWAGREGLLVLDFELHLT